MLTKRALYLVLISQLILPSFVHAEPEPAATEFNKALSNVLTGKYVADTVGKMFEDVVGNWFKIPFVIDPIEGELDRVVQRESARYTKNLVSKEIGVDNFSVGPQPGSSFNPTRTPQKRSAEPFHVKTTVSMHRLALSLIFRF